MRNTLLLLALILGCTAPPDGTRQSNIIAGDVVLNALQTGVVEVTFDTPKGTSTCSGTLLTPSWTLTARHCFPGSNDDAYPVQPKDISVKLGDSPDNRGQTKVGAIELLLHPTLDVALVRTTPFLAFQPLTRLPLNDRNQPTYAQPPSTLNNQTLRCVGWGANRTDDTGVGTLRQAFLQVANTSSTNINVRPNSRGQNVWSADSGGPCFTTGAEIAIAGIMLRSNDTGADVLPASTFRDWATMSRIDHELVNLKSSLSVGYDGSVIQTNAADESTRWHMVDAGGGTWRIVNRKYGYCLMEPPGYLFPSVEPCYWQGAFEKWTYGPEGQLRPYLSDSLMCLDIWGAAWGAPTGSGTLVSMSPCGYTASQGFNIRSHPVDFGRPARPMTLNGQPTQVVLSEPFEIHNLNSGLCLDVPGFATVATNLQEYPCNNGSNQQFIFAEADSESGMSYVFASGGDMVIDIPSGTTAVTPLQQFKYNGGFNQRWTPRLTNSALTPGSKALTPAFHFESIAGNMWDQPPGSSLFQQYPYNGGGNNQKWVLSK